MACREIDEMRMQLSGQMKQTLYNYRTDLQSRYGDPRVYAMQQAEMERRDQAVAFDNARRDEVNLRAAYEKQAVKNRETHTKRRARQAQKKRPE